ncbi:MAG: hypothetical protein NVSMB14_00250 [Isosphaeraceae bacterium]
MLFEMESIIAAPPDVVYAFHERADALSAITPPWERVTIVGGVPPIAVGNRVILKTKIGPFPATWVAEYVEVEPGRLFADRQVSGPFASWLHRHHFTPDGKGGTILRDSVQYEPPMGVIGRIFGEGFIKKKLNDMFQYRHKETKRLIEK